MTTPKPRKARKGKAFNIFDWWWDQLPWTNLADIKRAYRLGLRHGRKR